MIGDGITQNARDFEYSCRCFQANHYQLSALLKEENRKII